MGKPSVKPAHAPERKVARAKAGTSQPKDPKQEKTDLVSAQMLSKMLKTHLKSKPNLKFNEKALDTIQSASEKYIGLIFKSAQLVAQFCGRDEVNEGDIKLVTTVREITVQDELKPLKNDPLSKFIQEKTSKFGLKFKPDAVKTLQQASENYISELLKGAQEFAAYQGREEIEDRDMELVMKLRAMAVEE